MNTSQVFSKNNEWVVYDNRNLDTGIPENGTIGMVNTKTKEIKTIYSTSNQSPYGPGVGAVTFSPVEDRVLFIHGIRNSDKNNPYTYSRRTGVSVWINKPGIPEFLDARNIIPPFTAGALRGGTHAHSWSADGKWVSFTYNDFIIDELSKKDTSIKDIRVVAVMNNSKPVIVPDTINVENNNGQFFSAVVTQVTDHPSWGSNEIDKAFDEGWIGANGYIQKNGKRQKRAIAFQGNVKDKNGKTKTEVFVADIPDDISKAKSSCPLEGTATTRPCVPAGVTQRRITFTDKGITGPRFWLRTTPDGKWIGFLSTDDKNIVQLFLVSPNGGSIKQLTHNLHSIEGPFNFSPDGKKVAYISDNSIFITYVANGFSERLTTKSGDFEKPTGPVVWSNNGKMLAYNRYIKESSGQSYLQVFLLPL
ncbi:MAG: DUF3748 domain-containing protein [Bacteroidetes bacterium]|nr:DUF3748 domain-containing protein [Bacteroidota bacterium]